MPGSKVTEEEAREWKRMYDYLKAAPRGYIRLEGNQAVELLSQLAEAVAIKYGRVG